LFWSIAFCHSQLQKKARLTNARTGLNEKKPPRGRFNERSDLGVFLFGGFLRKSMDEKKPPGLAVAVLEI
jgi:hypothetical protein